MSVHVTPAATTPIPVQLSETEFTTYWLRVLQIVLTYCSSWRQAMPELDVTCCQQGHGTTISRANDTAIRSLPVHEPQRGAAPVSGRLARVGSGWPPPCAM
jgi:hypothetical protein